MARASRRAGTRIAVPATLLASVLLAACASSGPALLSTGPVAGAIERSILSQDAVATTVACPSRTPMRAGFRFRCVAHLAVGTYPVEVTETNAKGKLTYATAAPLRVLAIGKVERAIADAVRGRQHLAASVRCPSPVLQQAGLRFTCRARTTRGTESFTVTEIGGAGRVRLVES